MYPSGNIQYIMFVTVYILYITIKKSIEKKKKILPKAKQSILIENFDFLIIAVL